MKSEEVKQTCQRRVGNFNLRRVWDSIKHLWRDFFAKQLTKRLHIIKQTCIYLNKPLIAGNTFPVCDLLVTVKYFCRKQTWVQLKKKRGKVRIANFISAKRLPNAAGGLGGAVSPPVGPGLSPGEGQGGKAPGKLPIFSSKKCPRLLNFESIFTTNIMNNNSV